MTRINVTKTFLPPLEEYQAYVEQIWERDWLTNQGPLLLELQDKLEERIGAEQVHFVANGTLALQVALRALDITEGEIITTPFTYVATTSAIMWERCEPVYVDIDPNTFCIDASKIEATITPRTKAIMPVHVFGQPCDIEAIDAIAKKHNLKVIYDAAHGFGVDYKGKSLLNYGDISICSFHSTKLFHTIEGGAIIARDPKINEKIELIKRFGHQNDDHYMLGTNAKASEFHAAMGLCNLKYIDDIIRKRKAVSALYDKLLGPDFRQPKRGEDYNYAYYPVVLDTEAQLLEKLEAFRAKDIFPRRYFYPSLNKLPYIKPGQSCPVSEDIAVRILCLPLYPDLDEATVKTICEVLKA